MGSWIEQNVDAGEYARQLMTAANEAAMHRAPSKEAPRAILVEAHSKVQVLVSHQGLATGIPQSIMYRWPET